MILFLMIRRPPISTRTDTRFPYTTLFRSGITVFAMVSLKSQAEDDLRAFEEHVNALPEVRECHMLNGEIDFILKIVSHDLQEFQKFLTARLTNAPNVAGVKTSRTIRKSNYAPRIPAAEK